MNSEKDKYLCEKYPKIFADRSKSIYQSCMGWGFEHGDGWFNIIDTLCQNIQHHIDSCNENNRKNAEYNLMIEDAKKGNWDAYNEYYKDFENKALKDAIHDTPRRVTDDVPPQVVARQVKEKYGGLCFYYCGGDEYIEGLVSMAESISYRICEKCGNPGSTNKDDGWISTLCESCR